jgi:hypothetical protein
LNLRKEIIVAFAKQVIKLFELQKNNELNETRKELEQ